MYEKELRGQPPYDPRMMAKLLVYGYCVGVYSARKIQRRLVEDVAFRMLAAGNAPDFRTISDLRKVHLKAGVRPNQASAQIPALLAARIGEGACGVGLCVPDAQHFEAVPDVQCLIRVVGKPSGPFPACQNGPKALRAIQPPVLIIR
jgi:hypothetical protein